LPLTDDSRFKRCEKHRARVKQFPSVLNLDDTGKDLVNESSSSTDIADSVADPVPKELFSAETDAITA
jgi:hypothetical protein